MSRGVVCLLVQKEYKPGDLPPEGYLEWHEWAEVQRKAGIRQVVCGKCCRWKTPQELSDDTVETVARDSKGRGHRLTEPICSKCATQTQGAR